MDRMKARRTAGLESLLRTALRTRIARRRSARASRLQGAKATVERARLQAGFWSLYVLCGYVGTIDIRCVEHGVDIGA